MNICNLQPIFINLLASRIQYKLTDMKQLACSFFLLQIDISIGCTEWRAAENQQLDTSSIFELYSAKKCKFATKPKQRHEKVGGTLAT